MKTTQPLTRDKWVIVILGLSLFFGLIVRLFPGLIAGFPLNDGGMFLTMIRDLRANGFVLPAFTDYNHAAIPYAYPPLGFYAAALLSVIGFHEIDILRWLPAVVNFLSIGGFFLLASALLDDRPRAAVAAAFFALTPGSFEWQIMGGGLTRAFGMAFLSLAVFCVYRLFQRGERKYVFLSILVCSLAVLSHPEVSLATATGCALIWVFHGRTRRGLLQAGLVAAGTLLITSLWWGSVLYQHGTAPFSSVLHSGAYGELPWVGLYQDFLAPWRWFTLLGLLQIAGAIWCIRQRQYFLLAWMVLPYIAEPRSAPAMAYLPLCALAAIGFADVLPAVVDWIGRKLGTVVQEQDFTQRNWLNQVLLGWILVLFVSSAFYDYRLINTSLRPPEPQQALEWTRRNTPADSRFLILSGEAGIMTDPIQEWFPALADRRSQTTLQGLEWTLGEAFFTRLIALIGLQRCEHVTCVEEWSAANDQDFTHVVIPKTDAALLFLEAFQADESYRSIYENHALVIFEK
jgi:hypothetical protein